MLRMFGWLMLSSGWYGLKQVLLSFPPFCSVNWSYLGWASPAITFQQTNVKRSLNICHHLPTIFLSKWAQCCVVSPICYALKSTCLCTCCSFCLQWPWSLVCSANPFMGSLSEKASGHLTWGRVVCPVSETLSLLCVFPSWHWSKDMWFLGYSLIPLLEWELLRTGNVYC